MEYAYAVKDQDGDSVEHFGTMYDAKKAVEAWHLYADKDVGDNRFVRLVAGRWIEDVGYKRGPRFFQEDKSEIS